MSRRLRTITPDQPLHITQRGVDRCPTFLEDEDYALYRLALEEASAATRCAVHAYTLMTNHVHLLVSPSDSTGPTRMMQSIGRFYVRHFNDKYRRTGTLWEGRFRSAHIDSERYLFKCYRYIELNPVRAGLVGDPTMYEWSSCRANLLGIDDPIVVMHPRFEALGADGATRCDAYRMLFEEELSKDAVAYLRAGCRGRPRLHPTPYRLAVEAVYGSGETPALTPGDADRDH